MDDITFAEKLQDHSNFPQLCPDVLNAENYTYCHWAKAVTGFDVNSEKWVVVGVTCKRWGCPYCANRKIRRLAWMARNAAPNKLLTLTVRGPAQDGRPGRYPDGESAWKATSKAFPELVRFIRTGACSRTKQTAYQKQEGVFPPLIPIECEYLRVLELQENGMPHFHCMLRSPFLLHSDLIAEWRRLIGEPDDYEPIDTDDKKWAGANIKAIDKSFATFRYLVKYLTKLHKIPWTDRHVSYSRDFFRPEDKEQIEYAKLDNVQKYDQHPWVWLRERYLWETVTVLDDGKYELPDYPVQPSQTCDPRSLGLPGEPDQALPPPLQQRLVPGMDAEGDPDHDDSLKADGTRRKTPRRRAPTIIPPSLEVSKPIDPRYRDF